MPRDNVPETDEYGQLVNPDEGIEGEVDLDELIDEEDDDLENLDWAPPSRDELEVETNSWDNRINQYKAAAEELGLEPDLIYEPANGADVSTVEAFPEADVLYAEVADHNTQAVNEEGYDVVLADAEQLSLSRTPDLVVFRNAAMDETEALENNSAEYVFANDWLGNASDIEEEMDNYQMIGTVRQNEDYFQPAESVAEGETPDDLYVFQKIE